nr:hypothetical protein [Tanacetum cinerariifolium]
MYRASNQKSIKALDKELEEVKLEKDGLDRKLVGLLKALKNLDHLIKSQRRMVQRETTRSQNHTYKRPPLKSFGHRPHGGSMRPSHRPAGYIPHGPSMNPRKPNMNCARPNRSFLIQAPSYETRPFLKSSAVKTQYRAPWVPTVNRNNPPQNGVTERSNRTLIEAARTMLANAKLPVTFWAEAVNTASYVQNKVLVNMSQNKTPYELFNGRTPAIGFLKPFGCHVMILNTLDNLGKFEAKGDEGYFIGYPMSGKAFRVFNKRTRRVEENLHVEFLENKAIEKSTDPNWLFHIDYLTKSMNYVPVDAHEALLESSSSKPHVESSTQVPEGSGNPNPTVSSSNPPTDQMETLTVESPIPTISLPVPTACLNNSPEPSSEARLISKRVANQEETPSLDNILSMTNRFEDILGVTPSLDEAIGVEADVSNMETTISASPTPTLRIHKYHPKSQIIGYVDTPIQARHKSKENKKDERGIVVRNKARLVAQGHTQEEGIDYDDVFVPVARIEAIRLFLAYASFMSFTVYQMDDPTFPAKVYKVEKAMYGLHQAARAWQREDFILVQVYVDDIFGSSNPQLCREFEALMHVNFQMSDMGELNFFLGLQVLQKEDVIFLSQDKYIGDILKKFIFSDVRSSNTLMDKENPWGKDETRKDSIVATSTTEEEYVAAASCCGQVL